eukprot:517318-Lingulodinium_polyedra.AAC.1
MHRQGAEGPRPQGLRGPQRPSKGGVPPASRLEQQLGGEGGPCEGWKLAPLRPLDQREGKLQRHR